MHDSIRRHYVAQFVARQENTVALRGLERRILNEILHLHIVGTTNMQNRPQAQKFELFLAIYFL